MKYIKYGWDINIKRSYRNGLCSVRLDRFGIMSSGRRVCTLLWIFVSRKIKAFLNQLIIMNGTMELTAVNFKQ
jgi:hypothetical protein